MASTQIVANQHSGLLKAMLSAGMANRFLYSPEASMPNVSNQLLKISPSSAFSSTTAKTTQEFRIPSSGFLTGAYLKFGYSATDNAGGLSAWAGCEAIEDIYLTARGRPLRKAHALSLEYDVASEDVYNMRINRENLVRKAHSAAPIATAEYVYLDVGKALGFEQSPQLALDAFFLQELTISVTFRATSDWHSCTGAQYVDSSSAMYMRFSQLEPADYVEFQGEQYSRDKPSKSLCVSWEKETDVTVVNAGTSAITTAVDIKHRGLLEKTVIAFANKTLQDVVENGTTKDRASFNNISEITLNANGVVVWSCDDANVIQGMLSPVLSPADVSGTTAALAADTADPDNLYVLDYSQLGINNKEYSMIAGCLNTADLTGVYLNVTWTPAAANNFVARVSHRVYQIQSINGQDGDVSVSAKE